MNGTAEKIRSRGYWEVTFRASEYREVRVENILALPEIIATKAVELRGWDFPHIDTRNEPQVGSNYVEQTVDWEAHVELWRAYQSGQFFYLGGLRYDWADQVTAWRKPRVPKDVLVLSVADAVYSISEYFEFAARLSSTDMGDDGIELQLKLRGLDGRQLWISDPARADFLTPRVAHIEEWQRTSEIARPELIARSRELALDASVELFRRFGWEPSREVLKRIQSELRWA